nr:hypothetical protein CFP56_22519 [Quercus suber]
MVNYWYRAVQDPSIAVEFRTTSDLKMVLGSLQNGASLARKECIRQPVSNCPTSRSKSNAAIDQDTSSTSVADSSETLNLDRSRASIILRIVSFSFCYQAHHVRGARGSPTWSSNLPAISIRLRTGSHVALVWQSFPAFLIVILSPSRRGSDLSSSYNLAVRRHFRQVSTSANREHGIVPLYVKLSTP